MNTANLQMEGLLMAVVALARLLEEKGIAGGQEIGQALARAEADARREASSRAELSPAEMEAILFPLRFLVRALQAPAGQVPSFRDIVADVGRSKPQGSERAGTPVPP